MPAMVGSWDNLLIVLASPELVVEHDADHVYPTLDKGSRRTPQSILTGPTGAADKQRTVGVGGYC